MDILKGLILLLMIIAGYLPYKLTQKLNPFGLSFVSVWYASVLSGWFILLSLSLFIFSIDLYLLQFGIAFYVLLGTVIIWFMAPYLIRRFGQYPHEYLKEYPKSFIVRFEAKTFYLKFFEIIFQQATFLFLLEAVFDSLSYSEKILWFTLVIGFLHLGNIFFIPKKETLFFFVVSFPMAFVFSYLLINGYLFITTTIHLWFYLLFFGFRWFKN